LFPAGFQTTVCSGPNKNTDAVMSIWAAGREVI